MGTHDLTEGMAEEGIEAEQIGDSNTVKEGLAGAAILSTNSNKTFKITANYLQDSVSNRYLRAYHEATNSGTEFPIDLHIAGTGERIVSAFATVTKVPKMASKKEAQTKTWEITARRCTVTDDDDGGSIAVAVGSAISGGVNKVFNFLT